MSNAPEEKLGSASAEELARFEDRLARESLCGHWQMVAGNRARSVKQPEPIIWRWTEILSALHASGDIIDIGGADDLNDRRTIHLISPSLAHEYRTTDTIQVAVQMVKPGETGEAHRHTQNAMRFIVDVSGDMYTTVDGEKLVMEPSDLLLTPNWAWHDHTNASEQAAIWVDILDANLTRHLSAHFKELWTEGVLQPLTRPEGYSPRRFGGVRPRTATESRNAVPYAYKWDDAVAAIEQLAVEKEGDPHEGYALDYVNPVNGGPTFPTMNCRLQMIPPHTTTQPIRRTGVTIYQAVRGEGTTYVAPGEGGVGEVLRTPGESREDKKLEWTQNDFMLMPSWRWEQHSNHTDEPVYLFSVSDRPALEEFGWYREERA